jgi:hypothetical protein
MSATIEIRELPEELSVRVAERGSIGVVFLNLAGGAVFGWIALRFLSGAILIAAVLALVAVITMQIIRVFQGADVQLRINNLDLISVGHSPSGYSSSVIPRADVSNLTFREASGGGGDFPDLPQGLYVEHNGGLWNGATCVLPHTDSIQTQEVIDSILRKYPDTGTLRRSDRDDSYLTLLNLSKPSSNE